MKTITESKSKNSTKEVDPHPFDVHHHLSPSFLVPGSWLTPVEIFSPWYGHSIADHILRKVDEEGETVERSGLEIFEIGGGSGTCMSDVLTRIQQKNPDLFNITTYTCIEISPRLAEAQERKAHEMQIPKQRWQVICSDFLQMNELLSKHRSPSFVIVLELLDNLPHDKVLFDDSGAPWEAVIVDINRPRSQNLRPPAHVMDFILSFRFGERKQLKSATHQEYFQPAKDPLILETLHYLYGAEEAYHQHISPPAGFFDKISKFHPTLRFSKSGVLMAASAVYTKQGIVYLPTGLVQFLKSVWRCIPHHHLVLSDFDALPGFVLPGASGPAVQSLGPGNRICERSSYLLDNISADIFFPTDFIALKYIYEKILSKEATVYSAPEFFALFEEQRSKCQTMSGYCPLLDDFANTSYLIS